MMRKTDPYRVDESSTVSRVAVGELVSVAARLGQQAGDGEILITDATYRMVRDSTRVEKLESPLDL
jgi:class 3 adenylate cyclase